MKNKFLTSLRALTLLLVMCLSIGNVWGGTEEVFYTNSCPANSKASAYATYVDVTVNDIKWKAPGNQYANGDWRLGGSGTSALDRYMYTQATLSADITKIVLTHGSKTAGDVGNVKLDVYSTAALAAAGADGDISSLSLAYADNSSMTFTRPDKKSWAGRYYRFSYSINPNATKNKYVSVKSIQFYYEKAGVDAPTFDPEDGTEFSEATLSVSISADEDIYYTLNTSYTSGEDVFLEGTKYTEALNLTATTTIQAVAVDDNDQISEIANATYTKVTPKVLTSVTVSGDASKKTYVAGDSFDPTGLVVTAHYESDPDETITEGITWTYNPSQILTKDQTSIGVKATVSEITSADWYNVTDLTVTAAVVYEKFTGDLVEDDYLICVSTDAMNNTVSSSRFGYTGVTVSSDKVTNPGATIVWHIAPSATDGYWTIYSANASKYAASTGAANKAQLLESGTDDMSLWSVEKSGTYYHFTNKKNAANSVNAKLQKNGTYGFACYSSFSDIVLYKKSNGKETVKTPTFSPAAGLKTEAIDVTISCATDGATIYYTLDGSTPTSSSTPYTATIHLDAATTVKAIAIKDGMNDSGVATAEYTFDLPYTSLAAFIEAAPTTEKALTLDAAQGVVIIGYVAKNIYVQDAAGTTMLLYNSTAVPEWSVGKRIEGTLTGTYDVPTTSGLNRMTLINTEGANADNDGVMPEPVVLTELTESEFASHKGQYIKMADQHFQATSLSSRAVDTKNTGETITTKLYDTFNYMASKTLPAKDDAAEIKGVFIKYNTTYELAPTSIAAGEAKISVAPEGGLDSEHAVALAKDAQVVVTPVADFTTSLNGETITEATNVTIDEAKSIVVAATRDFYTDKSVTYYYKVDASAKAVTVNQPEVGGTIAADPISASAGATITLTHSAAPHYTFGSFTVVDASSNPVTVNENEGVYTFEMPNSDVTVTGTFIENAKATATFAKGEESATGDAPADIEWYVGENITLPANTFSFAGHKFAGWNDGANVYAAGASYEMPEGGKAFTATWEALSVWATTYTSNVTVGSDKVRFTTEGTQYDAKKAGKSGSAGSTTVTVPVGATALHFHAAGWSTEDVTLQVSKGGVAIQSFALPRDAGMNNNSPFTLANDPAQTEYFMVALSEITEETVITFAATAGKRFAIYGVNAVFPPALTLDPASKAFGEVKVGANAEQVFTITPNAFVTGTLEAELTGTDADQFAVGAISDNQVTVTFQPDKVNASVSANLRVKSMVSSVEEAYVEAALTGVAISAETPEISLDKEVVDFGVVSQGASVAAQTVAATLTYLAEANVAVTGTAFSVSPATLTASGDITITPNTANVGVYEETLTVSGTGATAKQVTVRMTVASKWATTYTSNVSFTATNTVGIAPNTYSAIKGGASKSAGTLNITFPAGVTDIHFHAVGWKGESVTLKVKNGSTELLSAALTNDEHVTGTDENFAIEADLSTFYYTIHLTNALEEATAITFTSEGSTNYRFVLFGINQEGGPEITSISISGEATKLTYIEGEEFDPAGLTVMANYNIGDPQDVTSNSTFTFDPALLSAGQTSVSVTAHFQEFNSAPLVVNGLTVSAITLESIKLSGNYQTTFHAGDAFNHDNLVVTAIYSNEDEEDVTDDAVVSNPDMSTAGKKTVTVTYGGKEATYGIVVLATTIVFYESFDTNDGTGGNDGQWSGSIASNAITSDNEGWTFTNAKGANKCAKFGSGSNLGSAKTPEITGTGDFVITFKAGAWDGNSENLNLVISTTNGTLSQEAVVLEKAKWNNYSIALTGVTENFQITIAAAQASNNRFFLDEVMVQKAYVRSLSSSNIGTVCVDKATSIENYSGATFYEILNKDADEKNVYFQEVVELEAGMPYIFQPSANILILPYASEETATAQSKNGLYGWLSDNYEFSSQIDSKDVYFVSGGKIVRCGNQCTILKNRAYIVLSEISGQGSEAPGRRRLVLGVEGKGVATGMEEAIIMSDGELKKVVIDGQFYILRDGKVFDAQGKLVK